MNGGYVIGIDIGTQGTKAALFDTDGVLRASAFVNSSLDQPGDGIVEEDPEKQVSSVCKTIRTCMAEAGIPASSVGGIGIDGQMAGVIGIGTDGRAVTPYDSWLDTRCAPYIGQMNALAGDEIIGKTGGPPSFNHGPKILRWKKEFPRVYREIKAFVQPGGYAAMRLCGLEGRDAFIDKTYLHFSGFADSQSGIWDADLCGRFDVSPEKLPKIVDSHHIVGTLSAAMARRCGLKAGVPVVAGCGDTAASFLASGAVRDGICTDVAGTASVFAVTTSAFVPDIRNRMLSCGRAAVPGLWHSYAYINGGGMNLEWFRENLGASAEGASAQETFKTLEKWAAKIGPSVDLPLFVPHLSGRVSPSRPDLRGAWVGLCRAHGTGHLYRSVLEGVALEYGIYRRVLVDNHPAIRLRELRVTGGGAASTLWNQIKADVLGMKVIPVSRTEGAPLGAALLAAYGAGLVKRIDQTAGQWIGLGSEVRPVRRYSSIYAARQKRYENLLEALEALC